MVSPRAIACPNCGERLNPSPESNIAKIALYCLAIFLTLAAVNITAQAAFLLSTVLSPISASAISTIVGVITTWVIVVGIWLIARRYAKSNAKKS